jgi:hypothetical protein
MTLGQIDATTQVEIIRTLLEKLRSFYVYPEIAEKICENLEKHLEAGDYADLNEGEFFAYALTVHLQEINHDEHLWVRWYPDPLPDKEEALYQNQVWLEEQRLAAKLDNYGFHKT